MSRVAQIWRGDTAQFALGLDVRADPDSGVFDPVDPWAGLQIWVRGQNLTAHTDQLGEVNDAIFWQFGELLEWFAQKWDALLHEQWVPVVAGAASLSDAFERPPTDHDAGRSSDRYDMWSRHCLLAARAGGPMRTISLRRFGNGLEVSWTTSDAAGTDLRYSEPAGTESFPVEVVAGTLYSFLECCAATLVALAPGVSRWVDLGAAVTRIAETTSNAKRARVSWLVGGEPSWQRLLSASNILPEGTAQDFAFAHPTAPVQMCSEPVLLFGTMNPRVSERDVGSLLQRWLDARREPSSAHPLLAREPLPLQVGTKPWEQGYSAAEEIREQLDLGDGPIDEVEPILARLGVAVHEIQLDDSTIPAVCLGSPHTVPTILINRACRRMSHRPVRRMALVHELAHLLLDRDCGQRIAVAEGAWAPLPVEQRARSFAVMWLMPEPGISRWIADSDVDVRTPAGLDAIAHAFGVSRQAAARHLYHLRYFADLDEADALVEELDRTS
jgi:Zn-dependent peptidase ImmA (M78 family)